MLICSQKALLDLVLVRQVLGPRPSQMIRLRQTDWLCTSVASTGLTGVSPEAWRHMAHRSSLCACRYRRMMYVGNWRTKQKQVCQARWCSLGIIKPLSTPSLNRYASHSGTVKIELKCRRIGAVQPKSITMIFRPVSLTSILCKVTELHTVARVKTCPVKSELN